MPLSLYHIKLVEPTDTGPGAWATESLGRCSCRGRDLLGHFQEGLFGRRVNHQCRNMNFSSSMIAEARLFLVTRFSRAMKGFQGISFVGPKSWRFWAMDPKMGSTYCISQKWMVSQFPLSFLGILKAEICWASQLHQWIGFSMKAFFLCLSQKGDFCVPKRGAAKATGFCAAKKFGKMGRLEVSWYVAGWKIAPKKEASTLPWN